MMQRTLVVRAWLCALSFSSFIACGESDKRDVSVTAPSADGGGLESTPGQWVWHEVDGSICANGSPTGLGVNRGSDDRVVIYMSGGSACLDEGCAIGTPSMRKDGGFGAKQLEPCISGKCDGGNTFPSDSIFDRASATNPFATATYVFISNCSGDYYVGDSDHAFPEWTAHFHGWRNQALFSAWVAAGLPSTSRVVLTGGSAGAVGAMLNYWRWVKAFPRARVDLISDSFALVEADRPQWRYDLHNPQSPEGCATCASDYRSVYAFNASLSTGSRIAVVDSENNWTLDLTSGYRYTKQLEALQPALDQISNLRYFIANGKEHVLLQHPLDSAETDVACDGAPTKTLADFLGKMQRDEAWESASCLGR